jgi:hypothetical protein
LSDYINWKLYITVSFLSLIAFSIQKEAGGEDSQSDGESEHKEEGDKLLIYILF